MRGRVLQRKVCGMGHKLGHWSSISGFRERIIKEFIKMNIRLIPRISVGQFI